MRIEYSSKAVKQLEKLHKNKPLLAKLFEEIEELATNPLAGKLLEGEHEGTRSLRVSAWRVIYRIDLTLQEVLVVRVAKRSDVYR